MPQELLKKIRRLTTIDETAFWLIFFWFGYQLIYFAYHIGPSIFPDEPYHIFVANLWRSATDFNVQDSPNHYGIGQVSRQPYMYHALVGSLRRVFPFNIEDINFYRSLSVVFSLIGFYFSWRFYQIAIQSVSGRIFAIYFQSCVMMYAFISAAASYDVLTNMVCMILMWYLFLYKEHFDVTRLLFLLVFLLIGALIKVTFLPFALFFVAAFFFLQFRRIVSTSFWKSGLSGITRYPAISLLALILLAFNAKFYGTNLIQYQSIVPSCERVLSEEICLKHYAQSRRTSVLLEKEGQVKRLSLSEYLPKYFKYMESSIFNLQTHRLAAPLKSAEMRVIERIFQLAAIGLIFQFTYFRRTFFNYKIASSTFIVVGYGCILIAVNFIDYMKYGNFELGLQGRYWFPVLTPAIYLIAAPIFENIKRPFQVLFLIAGFFALQKMGFHIFEYKVDSTWFR